MNREEKANCFKIGILGGTFDPIHNGHLMIAEAALKEYALSKVIFIPTGISYMKKNVTDSYFRYEMTSLAIQNHPEFAISDVEIERKGNTYTCDTIEYFKKKHPDAELFFIIGTDSLFSLEKWRNIEYVFRNCTILCATRTDDDTEEHAEQKEQNKAKELCDKFDANINFIHCPTMDISSTEIRIFRKEHPGSSLNSLDLPECVADYILRHDLYSAETDKIHNQLKEDIKPKRFRHTMGVVDIAVRLALQWGCTPEKARLAALLHDCAKYIDIEHKIALCAKFDVSVSDIEINNPELLHAKAGALLAYENYKIIDTDILSAIYYHTTGKPEMSLLEQIIYVADYIEPGRKHSDKLPEYRELAMLNLNKVTALILKDNMEYLQIKHIDNQTLIDPMTLETYEFYKKYL